VRPVQARSASEETCRDLRGRVELANADGSVVAVRLLTATHIPRSRFGLGSDSGCDLKSQIQLQFRPDY
jgi:hypothetical protein